VLIPDAVVDLKYRGDDNFVGRDVYGGLRRCFLVDDAATMLIAAREHLHQRAPELTFVLWDGARPKRAQEILFADVEGTAKEPYVANPHEGLGSMHSYGCAIDLGLVERETGRYVDMGTDFDHFGPEAEPREELQLLKDGSLTAVQLANRLLLREVMVRAGWRPLSVEWWHFNAFAPEVVGARYALIP